MTIHVTSEDRELVQSLRAEGLSLSEISRVVGLSAPEIEEEKRFVGLEVLTSSVSLDWFRFHF